jgi:hypothetical protein
MGKRSKGSFANIEETRAALRESANSARKLTEQSERLLAKRSEGAALDKPRR